MKIYRTLPDLPQITAFQAAEQDQPFTYSEVGQTAHTVPTAPGFDHDHQRVVIGQGPADYEQAKEALHAWVHFPEAWTKILPEQAPLQSGVTVAMFFRLFGFWWRNSCRIVYVVDEERRFGFAYGTLPGHMESGEEIFQVEIDEAGAVWYELRAFSRPRHRLARLGYPLVRFLQEKFRQDSALAMRHFVRPEAPVEYSGTPNEWALRLVLFFLAAGCLWPGSFLSHDYGRLPLAFAVLVVVPAALSLAARHFPDCRPLLSGVWPYLLPAGLAAVVAQALPSGPAAAMLALPWLLVCARIAWTGVRFLLRTGPKKAADVPMSLGFLYLLVGGAWWLADRAGLRPWDFGQDLVRLTALHFHYAGFALTVLAAVAARFYPNFLAKLAAWGVALGVPLTAAGITATQMAAGPWLETFAAVFMAVAGLLAAMCCLVLGARNRNRLLLAGGTALGVGMLLALTYALRIFYPQLSLSLDWMRALHGSLNGLVAIPLGLLGLWWLGFSKRVY